MSSRILALGLTLLLAATAGPAAAATLAVTSETQKDTTMSRQMMATASAVLA